MKRATMISKPSQERTIMVGVILGLLVTACTGKVSQQPQPSPTVWVTPLPVPTVAIADFLSCNATMVALFQRDEIDLELSYVSGPFGEIAASPTLLVDRDWVNDTFSQVDRAYEWARNRAQQEGPECLADYRNGTLEILGLAHHYFALVQAGNFEAADEVFRVMNEKMDKVKNEILPTLLEKAGMN